MSSHSDLDLYRNKDYIIYALWNGLFRGRRGHYGYISSKYIMIGKLSYNANPSITRTGTVYRGLSRVYSGVFYSYLSRSIEMNSYSIFFSMSAILTLHDAPDLKNP